MKLKNYFGNKNFYEKVLTIAIPIMIQNFITNFVSMLDNLMVGSLGTEQVSGVAIVNQMYFVFTLAIFGAVSGAGIFISQFYGKEDEDGIRFTFRFKAIVCCIITALAVIIYYFAGGEIIKLFLHDGSGTDIGLTYKFAKSYLNICLIGIIPFAVTQMYASTLRETGETFIPMVMGFIAVCVNAVFNFLLIFGKFGFPRLGVNGAAVATNIARFCECGAILFYCAKNKHRHRYFAKAFRSLYIPLPLFKDIIKKGLPLLVNETLWSVGMSLVSMSYSLHGLAVVAGYSISSTVINLFNIAFMSFGSSIGIIVGKMLGADQFEKAVDCVRKLMVFSIIISFAIGALVFAIGGYIPMLYNTSPESKRFATYFIKTAACFMPVVCFSHCSYFTLRSGGRTLVTFLVDSVFICTVSVPISFALYYWFGLSIWTIFPIIQSVEIIKCIIGYILIKKRVWVQNIVG